MADEIMFALVLSAVAMFGLVVALEGFWYAGLAWCLFVIFYLDMVRDGN